MHLTEREDTILDLLSRGYSNREIAKRLYISTHTVKAHLESIYYKIGAKNRVQATRLYITQLL